MFKTKSIFKFKSISEFTEWRTPRAITLKCKFDSFQRCHFTIDPQYLAINSDSRPFFSFTC